MQISNYIQQSFQVNYAYRVFFTHHIFSPDNNTLSAYLQEQGSPYYQKRLLVVADEGVWQQHPYLQLQAGAYLQNIPGFELAPEIIIIPGGEAVKNDEALFFRLVDAIDKYAIDRHSFVIGIGGGSVLDLVGFAAAVSHRGVRHIRIPTTVLSQNDSGVGVKNGINYKGKKNFLGAFAPPAAVFNDAHFLTTLEDRDWNAGMVEAVKVALIKDAAFFEWMEREVTALANRDMEAMQQLVYRCAELHLSHIGGAGDPFESGSSRPLDFGHWSGHKLEQLTNFTLRHGEAVAIGIALDSVYTQLLGWLDKDATNRILHLLQEMSLPIYHPLLDMQAGDTSPVIKGLEEFREHLGGRLTICQLKGIGYGAEVNDMNITLLQQAGEILKKLSAAGE